MLQRVSPTNDFWQSESDIGWIVERESERDGLAFRCILTNYKFAGDSVTFRSSTVPATSARTEQKTLYYNDQSHKRTSVNCVYLSDFNQKSNM